MSRPTAEYMDRHVTPGVDFSCSLSESNIERLWVIATAIHDHDFGFDSGFPYGNAEHDDPYWCRADDVLSLLIHNRFMEDE